MPAAIHLGQKASELFAVGALTPLIAKITDRDMPIREMLAATPGLLDELNDDERLELDLLCDESPRSWQRDLRRTINRQLHQQYRDHKAGKDTYPVQLFFVQGDYGVENIGRTANGRTRIVVRSPWLNTDTGRLETGETEPNPLTAHAPGA